MFTALAQAATTTNCTTFVFGGCTSVTQLINALVGSFFAVIWIIAVVFLAYAGIMYITSAGDKGKAEEAKKALTNALIGIAIVLGINIMVGLLTNVLQGGDTVNTPTVSTGALPTLGK